MGSATARLPFPDDIRTSSAPALLPSPVVTVGAGAGLLVIAGAFAMARSGMGGAAAVYWAGVLLMAVPVLMRLVSETPQREPILNLITVAVALQLTRLAYSPNLTTGFDELLHVRTLADIADTGALFTPNSMLPVSPLYPGLESLTVTIQEFTGLASNTSIQLALIGTRILAALALFLLFRLALGSDRVAAAASAVYLATPQYVEFNGQFAYQSLAIPLALASITLALRWALTDAAGRVSPTWPIAALALVFYAGATATHHLTGGAFLLLLGLMAVLQVARRRPGGGRLSLLALVMGLILATWTRLVSWDLVAPYVEEILGGAIRQVLALMRGESPARQLFSDESGQSNPLWQNLLIVASTLALYVLVPLGLVRVWRRRRNESSILLALAMLGASFLVLVVGRFSPLAAEVADRASTFVYLGVAVLVGPLLLLGRWREGPPPRNLAALRRWVGTSRIVSPGPLLRSLLVVIFLGGFLLGGGQDSLRLPGAYEVAAGRRSADAQQLAAARWGAQNLPAGSRLASDRTGQSLMAALADVHPVTSIGDGVYVTPLLANRRLDGEALDALERGRIDYVAVDRRLSLGLPRDGIYFERGDGWDSASRVPYSALVKFDWDARFNKVYSNGEVTLYQWNG